MKISSRQRNGQPTLLRKCLYLGGAVCLGAMLGIYLDGATQPSVSPVLELLHSVEPPQLSIEVSSPSTTGASSSTTSTNKKNILDDLLFKGQKNKIWLDMIWENLIDEAAALKASGIDPGVVMEVGMHKATQCFQAARAGLDAHCVEPSPKSFQRIQNSYNTQSEDMKQRIHLYNKAASNKSEGTVPFTTSGGTGDHVGDADMWKMEKVAPEEMTKEATVVEVPQVALDDIVKDAGGTAFLIKVDTQGFEPVVFSGLTESLREHKLKYIILEYWPRGMDLLAGKKDACVAADLLQELLDAGYYLYALSVQAHPRAPQGYKEVVNERPLDDIRANCLWYFGLEQQFPSEEYKMGYWSDILAVAPDATLPANPTTKVGKMLQPQVLSTS